MRPSEALSAKGAFCFKLALAVELEVESVDSLFGRLGGFLVDKDITPNR